MSKSTRPLNNNKKSFEELIVKLKALRLRECAIIEQLENLNSTFKHGDQVHIASNSRVRKPRHWFGGNANIKWSPEKERIATVTKVNGDKVYVTTDNRVNTWRALKNLAKIH